MSFKSARKKAHLTQLEVAELLGLNQSTVCLWETGETMPRGKTIIELANLYECSLEELLDEDADKKVPVCEAWTGEVIGTMHVYNISFMELAEVIGWNDKYLSMVLNGHRTPKKAEQKIKAALAEMISK